MAGMTLCGSRWVNHNLRTPPPTHTPTTSQLEESTVRQRLGGRRDSAAQISSPNTPPIASKFAIYRPQLLASHPIPFSNETLHWGCQFEWWRRRIGKAGKIHPLTRILSILWYFRPNLNASRFRPILLFLAPDHEYSLKKKLVYGVRTENVPYSND